jgi:hypothetical protein
MDDASRDDNDVSLLCRPFLREPSLPAHRMARCRIQIVSMHRTYLPSFSAAQCLRKRRARGLVMGQSCLIEMTSSLMALEYARICKQERREAGGSEAGPRDRSWL